MIKYYLVPLPHFKRDIKRLQRKHVKLNNLAEVFELLHVQNVHNIRILKARYKDHALKGNNQGYRELHLAPDIILKY